MNSSTYNSRLTVGIIVDIVVCIKVYITDIAFGVEVLTVGITLDLIVGVIGKIVGIMVGIIVDQTCIIKGISVGIIKRHNVRVGIIVCIIS